MFKSIILKLILSPLGSILQKIENYTVRATSCFKNSVFIRKLTDLIYSKTPLSDIKVGSLIIRLILISGCLAILSTIFGYLLFSKIGWAFQEGRPMTLLSFFMLFTIGYVLHLTWEAARTDLKINYQQPQTAWWFLSWGFFIAAWDELLRLHETLDRQIHKLLGVKPSHISDHLDDLFVAMYGVTGILILIFYLKEIIKFISVWKYFLGAATMGCISVIVDVLCADKPFLKLFVEDPNHLQLTIDLLDVFEESFKIFSEIFFVGLVVAIYKIQTGSIKTGKIEPNNLGLTAS